MYPILAAAGLLALSAVDARPIPHTVRLYRRAELETRAFKISYATDRAAPKKWSYTNFEEYTKYHYRYMTIDCPSMHDTAFFTECCHPRLYDQADSDFSYQCSLEAHITADVPQTEITEQIDAADVVADKQRKIQIVSVHSVSSASVVSVSSVSSASVASIESKSVASASSIKAKHASHVASISSESAASVSKHHASVSSVAAASASKASHKSEMSASKASSSLASKESSAAASKTHSKSKETPSSSSAAPSSSDVKPVTHHKQKPTPTPSPSSSSPSETPTPTSSADQGSGNGGGGNGGSSSGGDSPYTFGAPFGTQSYATFYTQAGTVGACGPRGLSNSVISDWSKVIALRYDTYGTGQDCGRMVEIKNLDNGKTVQAMVNDECMGCQTATSIDLSLGAYSEIGDWSTGMLNIEWGYIS